MVFKNSDAWSDPRQAGRRQDKRRLTFSLSPLIKGCIHWRRRIDQWNTYCIAFGEIRGPDLCEVSAGL